MEQSETLSASWSPEQLVVMYELATGSSRTHAAKVAGVSRGTVHRWLADEVYSQAVLDMKNAMFDAIQHRLEGAAIAVVDALVTIVKSDSSTANEKIAASRIIANKVIPEKREPPDEGNSAAESQRLREVVEVAQADIAEASSSFRARAGR